MPGPTQENTLTKNDEKPMEFIPYGCQDKIKLTVEIVKNLIAVPSKSGRLPGARDCIRFMMLAQAKKLNPFEGDAFLLGYDKNDGTTEFSLITAHQAYLKRAELHPEFDGMRSGVIVVDGNEVVSDLEGDFHLDSQTVIGGWATVFFKTRKTPCTRRVRLKRFQKPWGVWQNDPAGMICKCAEADALRSSFPTMLGGLYLREEIELPMTVVTAHEINPARLVEVRSADLKPEQPAQETTVVTDEKKPVEPNPDTYALGRLVIDNGFTFDEFKRWGTETGQLEAPDIADFSEVPNKVATRLLRAKVGLLKGLAAVKEGQPV